MGAMPVELPNLLPFPSTPMRINGPLAAAAAVLLTACGDTVSPRPLATPLAPDSTFQRTKGVAANAMTGIAVTPDPLVLVVGKTFKPVVSLTSVNGATYAWTGSGVTYRTLSAAVATVGTDGTVRAVATGSTKLIVSLMQVYTDTVAVVVQAAGEAVSVSPKTAQIRAGESVALTASGGKKGVALVWKSSDTRVATVSTAGKVTGIGLGTAQITVTDGVTSATSTMTVTKPLTDSSTTTAGTPGSSVYVIPASIDVTGKTDVTGAINAFLASVPNGATAEFRAGATYRIEGTVEVVDRRGLIIDGKGARFIANEREPDAYATRSSAGVLVKYPWRTRIHWSIEGGSNVVVRNMTIRGANFAGGRSDAAYVEALEAQHGVAVAGAENVLVENVSVSYVFGDFVYIGGRTVNKVTVIPRNVTVRGGTWSNNGRQGIAITDGDGVLVDGIRMTETRRASIDLESNSAASVIRNVTIRNSYFGPGRLLWLAAAGSGGAMENVTLENNRLAGRTGSVRIVPPEGSRRKNFRLIGNVSDFAGGGGDVDIGAFNVWRVDGFVARGNKIPLQAYRGQVGASFRESCQIDVPAGQFPGASPEVAITPYSCK
jgi:hypothetical protein